jgi:hypothetical protein
MLGRSGSTRFSADVFFERMKRAILLLLLSWVPGVVRSQTATTAWVTRAPVLSGTVAGSLQQMSAESVKLDSAAVITGDLRYPDSRPSLERFRGRFGGR